MLMLMKLVHKGLLINKLAAEEAQIISEDINGSYLFIKFWSTE